MCCCLKSTINQCGSEIYLPLVVAGAVAVVDASDENVDDNDMVLLVLILVASVRLFTNEADAVISDTVGLISARCPEMVEMFPLGAGLAAAATAPADAVVVDIEFEDCEEEFSR